MQYIIQYTIRLYVKVPVEKLMKLVTSRNDHLKLDVDVVEDMQTRYPYAQTNVGYGADKICNMTCFPSDICMATHALPAEDGDVLLYETHHDPRDPFCH